ncbi:Sec-independent protein translocase subunit TatA [Jongsikchunia kroppenstedtii]|uniref:Sec-independent protein translocase subunit TatA n=1 Tax=Jongsikchunia kroppenstedtii TaxID=1121721 RepID=UPI00036B70F0|nr:Sec-independent protein translocase subunit TatA [Jongsikchunia kroppenstedtii]
MGAIQPWHIIVVVIVALILFGSKKLPDAARGLGRSLRIFKSEVREMQNESKAADTADAPKQLEKSEPAADAVETPTETEKRSA